jgi:twitching motility protein PilI
MTPADRAMPTHPADSPVPPPGVSGRAWLAVEAGGLGLLLPLQQAGEIFPLAPVLPVAHTRPWFLGVANLRGGLHGVVDLAAFLGLAAGGSSDVARSRQSGRLLALNPELRALCALKVDHLAGLRRFEEGLQPVAIEGPVPAFAVAVWRDAQGRLWQELDLAELVASEAFLAIAQEPAA